MAQILIYPSGPSFNMDYYVNKHMPVVASKWGPYGLKSYKILTFQEGAPYQVQAILEWPSVEAFDKAAASETSSEIFGDLRNYYSEGDPIILKGKTIASELVTSP
ncbi:hypothetical protein ACHAPJ_013023 [Fusarium lateritium]